VFVVGEERERGETGVALGGEGYVLGIPAPGPVLGAGRAGLVERGLGASVGVRGSSSPKRGLPATPLHPLGDKGFRGSGSVSAEEGATPESFVRVGR
jgi:hypothetical protein